MEQIKTYTFLERLKYTYKRKWFCRRAYRFCSIPTIATNQDIFIDYIWRDIKQKNNRKLKTKT